MAEEPVLGLALGSGGARGAAHVGVLNVLNRAGFTVAAVAGSSAGAGVGGLYAAGIPVGEIEAFWLKTNLKQVIKSHLPTFPRSGWSTAREFVRMLRELVGEARIEELPIPYAAVATDINLGEECTLTEGPLVEAIRASTAIPGLFTPVRWEGRYLVDGGLLNPLPVDVVRRLGPSVVIAVDVLAWPSEGFQDRESMAGRLLNVLPPGSRLERFLRKRLPEGEVASQKTAADRSAPGVFYILVQSSTIFQRRLVEQHLALHPPEVLIRPRFTQTPRLWQPKEAIAAGEAATREALPRIEAALERTTSRP